MVSGSSSVLLRAAKYTHQSTLSRLPMGRRVKVNKERRSLGMVANAVVRSGLRSVSAENFCMRVHVGYWRNQVTMAAPLSEPTG